MRLTTGTRRALVWAISSSFVAAIAVADASIVGLGAMSWVVPVAIVVGLVSNVAGFEPLATGSTQA
jgi:hypothetical protein